MYEIGKTHLTVLFAWFIHLPILVGGDRDVDGDGIFNGAHIATTPVCLYRHKSLLVRVCRAEQRTTGGVVHASTICVTNKNKK